MEVYCLISQDGDLATIPCIVVFSESISWGAHQQSHLIVQQKEVDDIHSVIGTYLFALKAAEMQSSSW